MRGGICTGNQSFNPKLVRLEDEISRDASLTGLRFNPKLVRLEEGRQSRPKRQEMCFNPKLVRLEGRSRL